MSDAQIGDLALLLAIAGFGVVLALAWRRG